MRILLTLATVLLPGVLFSAERPNILWLSCEDIGPHLGCYGDNSARTPDIDRFAEQSVRFDNATVVAPVCAPCRSSIITGMYPTSIGTNHMRCRATLPEFVRPFSIDLRQSGYYCTNNSKKDYQFVEPSATWDESSGKAHWRHRTHSDQPFFAVFNYTGTHESQIFNEAQHRATTAGIEPCDRNAVAHSLPPYYPDTPLTREDWGRYYDNIAALDRWFGRMMSELAEDGLVEDTIVFFWSDHGVGLPRAKRWVYDSGMRVPLLVYVPPKWRERFPMVPGSVDDSLVSLMDLGPTVLKMAGLEIPTHMQGQSFLGTHANSRSFLFAARDRMDDRYDVIRAVRDKRYKYIVNFQAWKPYYQHISYAAQSNTMREISRLSTVGELPPAAAKFTGQSKPFEELYDLSTDPHELNNLMVDPSYQDVAHSMRVAQRNWMRETLDLGLMPESEIDVRGAAMGSRYAILRQPGGAQLLDRLLAAAECVSTGQATPEGLVALLDDPDPAVRWWAVTGMGNLVRLSRENREDRLNEGLEVFEDVLDRLLHDSSGCIRIASARAICLLNKMELGLPVLISALTDDNPWLRLEAALVLDELGDAAEPALGALITMVNNRNSGRGDENYSVRVAEWIVQKFK